MTLSADRPLGIYHEHPDWYRPLFAELDRRGVPYEKLNAANHAFDPTADAPWSLVFNRMSPSAPKREAGHAVFYTSSWLAHLEEQGVRVVNGRLAWAVEISKAHQLSLLRHLGLPYPAARVINHPAQAPAASEALRFPVVIKPNVGGSGAGIRLFDTPESLRSAVESGELSLGIDQTALVQEYIPRAEQRIVRVEVLGGRFLYAIRIYSSGETFDLCPADVCLGAEGEELVRGACPVDAPKNDLRVEGYVPPDEIVAQVEQITASAGIEVGGVEYLIDARDGRLYFYDINANSNFVADAPRVVGFDPFTRLVDWLEEEAVRAVRLGKEAA